jgi:hypothetical protein
VYDITLLIYPIGENSEMFCKQEMWTPYSYTSNETTLTLDFKSDGHQTRQGFLLSYQIAGTYNVFLQIYIIVMRERERERQTDKQTDRQTDRERERERERERASCTR